MIDIKNNTGVIILAAGKGTRMKSEQAKVLHKINGVPMIHYVVSTALDITRSRIYIVVGHQAREVEQAVSKRFKANFVLQAEQQGTGHAVKCALPHLSENVEHVVILCGDVPLLTRKTVRRLLNGHLRDGSDITVLAVNVKDPSGYGRILTDGDGRMRGIVEEADADEGQRAISLINTGIYCVKKMVLQSLLAQVNADNAQNEYYLTDIIDIGHHNGLRLGVEVGLDPQEMIGINTIAELDRAEKILQGRTREPFEF